MSTVKRLPIFCEICPINERNINKNRTIHIKYPEVYKTILCKSWLKFGSCKYGKRCQFAHGLNEIRSKN